jgi:hypothetical protein
MQAKEYSGEYYMFKVVEQMVNATFHCQVLFMQVPICFSFGGSLSSGHEFLISLQAFHIAGLFPLQSFCKMKRKREKKSAVEFHVKWFRVKGFFLSASFSIVWNLPMLLYFLFPHG